MQRKAVNTLLLGIVAWNLCKVEMRLCAVAKDDRIVFPVDNSADTQSWNSFNISNSTELPLNSTTLALDKLSADSHSDSKTNSTTLALDKLNLDSHLDSNSNNTTLALDKLNPDSHSDSEMDSNSTMTTALPAVDNRILVDTLPVCGPGFQLRAGRCRKAA
ncbi:hypothetical protein ACLKA7_013566 [Drosophila subpalustris]